MATMEPSGEHEANKEIKIETSELAEAPQSPSSPPPQLTEESQPKLEQLSSTTSVKHVEEHAEKEEKDKGSDHDGSGDDDLEEGELKDDDEDDSDDDEMHDTKRLPDQNNDTNNNGGFGKESSYNGQQRNHGQHEPHPQNYYPPHHSGGGGHPPQPLPPQHPYQNHQPGGMYPRGGQGGVGPAPKLNARCRFYSRLENKCTWGPDCRFEHRDDSPGPEFEQYRLPDHGMGPGSSRGPPMVPQQGRPYPYPPRHQPYPVPPPPNTHYNYAPYEQAYGPPPHHHHHHHHPSTTPPLPAHPMPVAGGAPSPNYPSPSSTSLYERKHRLAYEVAPWNEPGYPPARYERGEPAPGGYPPPGGRGGFHPRNHHSREAYGREQPPPHHIGGPHPFSGYPQNYPSAYRGVPMGPHVSHYKYSSSSQRSVPADTRRSRSNKRDEDESSWSDSGSEDSILDQASYSHKGSKKHHHQPASQPTAAPTTTTVADNPGSEDPLEQGSGTPPGEPLPDDDKGRKKLLNKLKAIEDMMAIKKGEQENPM